MRKGKGQRGARRKKNRARLNLCTFLRLRMAPNLILSGMLKNVYKNFLCASTKKKLNNFRIKYVCTNLDRTQLYTKHIRCSVQDEVNVDILFQIVRPPLPHPACHIPFPVISCWRHIPFPVISCWRHIPLPVISCCVHAGPKNSVFFC